MCVRAPTKFQLSTIRTDSPCPECCDRTPRRAASRKSGTKIVSQIIRLGFCHFELMDVELVYFFKYKKKQHQKLIFYEICKEKALNLMLIKLYRNF